MWRSVQAIVEAWGVRLPGLALTLLAAILVSGCAARGITLDTIAADRSIVTGSTNGAAAAPDPVARSDERTIRDFVSAADLESLGVGESVGWTNARTGSRGRVVEITEHENSGRPCRRFRTTRESFDGVAVYSGEACLLSDNEWAMLSFARM